MKRLLTHGLTAALALASGALAQSPRVTAQLSTGVAKLGDQISLRIVVENSEDVQVGELPAVPGLRFMGFGRPSREVSSGYLNGRVTVSQKLTFSTAVRPELAGEFTIPPIDVVVDQKRLQTAALALKVVADLRGAELGFIEVLPSTTQVIEGAPFTVEVRFGWDTRLEQVNWAALSIPWLDQLPGVVELQSPPPGSGLVEVGLDTGGKVVCEDLGPLTRGSSEFRTLRFRRSYIPSRAGTLELGECFLEFGELQNVGFFERRKTESWFTGSKALSIAVRSLPEAGRPLDFTGAIGRLEMRASANPRDVQVGESIKFTLEWTGAGNLEFFDAPELEKQEAFRAFRVYGTTEEKSFERRRVTYDLAPVASDVQSIPAVELSYYDLESESYQRLSSAPIPIRVRMLEGARGLAAKAAEVERVRDLADIDAQATARGEPWRPGPNLALGSLIGAPLLGLLARAIVRRRGDPAAPAERRRRRARAELQRRLARTESARAELDAWLEFLAARTKQPATAWIGRDGAELAPEALRSELAGLSRELEAAAWSNGQRVEPARVLTLADRIVAVGL